MDITYGCGAPSSLLRLLLESFGGLIVSLALFLDVALIVNSAVRAIVPLQVTEVGTTFVYKSRQALGSRSVHARVRGKDKVRSS